MTSPMLYLVLRTTRRDSFRCGLVALVVTKASLFAMLVLRCDRSRHGARDGMPRFRGHRTGPLPPARSRPGAAVPSFVRSCLEHRRNSRRRLQPPFWAIQRRLVAVVSEVGVAGSPIRGGFRGVCAS